MGHMRAGVMEARSRVGGVGVAVPMRERFDVVRVTNRGDLCRVQCKVGVYDVIA